MFGVVEFQHHMAYRGARAMAARRVEEDVNRVDEHSQEQPPLQRPVPQPAPAPAAPAVPDMGGFFQAFQTYLQRPPPPPAPQTYLDRFLKLAPSPFKGERNPDIGEAWLNDLEKKF